MNSLFQNKMMMKRMKIFSDMTLTKLKHKDIIKGNFIRILLLICMIIFFNPQTVKAQSLTILAGEAVVTKENYEILAYKEIQSISNLLITDPVKYMEEYNRILRTYNKYLKMNTMYNLYSEEDIEYLERCVETETYGGEDFISKVNIANVIINRMMDDERFPSTITEVVTAPGQFAYGVREISPMTIAACEYACINLDTTNGALWFHSKKKTDTFNGAEYIFTDNSGHHFYK